MLVIDASASSADPWPMHERASREHGPLSEPISLLQGSSQVAILLVAHFCGRCLRVAGGGGSLLPPPARSCPL